MKLSIHPHAEAEVQDAAAWYERQRIGLGVEFLAEVDAALSRIRQSPSQFSRLETIAGEQNVRRLLLKRFPYAVVYESSSDTVCVLAVTHTRRRPNYWLRRR
jgi:plasmid stabilization system protein ParE